ncbi:TadE/TadG family type IV pilus assembly protein [Pontivivens nitratireducens]|uniref:TadE/TadG family type IV pilus assembly protein n=1 Tax=Pontivivens nitratireducens TaxID=2758038 RepID=UPI0024BF7FAC|nr:TadE family protein [Pontibrevibacter nitratireducens]
MRVGRKTLDRIRKFFGDSQGAITVEFVVTLPVLLAALGFAEQYGQAMQTRNSLDVAARDAARFISRAPLDPTGTTVPDEFLCKARGIIETRMGDSISLFDGAADGTDPLGCTGYHTNAGGEIATNENGQPIVDSISIVSTASSTRITIKAYAEFAFVKFIGMRDKDAEFTTENGVAVYNYTELEQRSFAEGIFMTATENWPRTQ